jgi:hypothetical protein
LLLTCALASLLESERKYPGKLWALYYNMPFTFSVEKILTELSISQNEQRPNSFGYNEDFLEKLLLDEAEPFTIGS